MKIGSNNIDNVDHFKYLGVWLDKSLSWSVHIEKITKTVNKRGGSPEDKKCPSPTYFKPVVQNSDSPSL